MRDRFFKVFWRRYAGVVMVGLLIVMGGYLRLANLENYYFNPDDTFHVYISGGKSFQELMSRIDADVHAPLLYLVIHVMLKISDNELWLRSVSLVPGILLIPLMYILGKKVGGRMGGWFMAFIATFGKAAVILSQVVRQYAMANMFLCAALIFALNYMEVPNKRNYVLFELLGFLAVFSHYLFVIPILVMALVMGWKTLKSGAWKWQIWLYLPLAVFLVREYIFQGSKIWPVWVTSARQVWLTLGFPSTLTEYLSSANNLVVYFTSTNILWVVVLLGFLASVGLILFYKRWLTLILFGGCLGSSLVMAGLKIYPFASTRHDVFLWIPFLLVVASGLGLANKIIQQKWKLGSVVKGGVLFVFFIICMTQLGYVEANGFYRVGDKAEFPLYAKDWETMKLFLMSNLTSQDVIITGDQVVYYWANAVKDNLGNLATEKKGKFMYNQNRVYFVRLYGQELTMKDLYEIYDEEVNGTMTGGKVMVVTLGGWGNTDITLWARSLDNRKIINKQFISGEKRMENVAVYLSEKEFVRSMGK